LSVEGFKRRVRPLYHSAVKKPVIRATSSVLQHAPISSERFGPPKGIVSVADWVEAARGRGIPAEYLPVHPSERLTLATVHSVEREDFYALHALSPDVTPYPRDEQGNRYMVLPPTYVVRIPGGRVVGAAGSVITPDDRLVSDLSPELLRERYIPQKHTVMTRMRLPQVTHVRGKIAVLATLFADSFFSHWMMDLLPRVGLIELAGIPLSSIDGFYIGGKARPFHRDTLAAMGIPADRIIEGSDAAHIKADELIAPSTVSGVFGCSQWTSDVLRKRFLDETGLTGKTRRIYVSRAGADHRKMLNEDELMQAIAPLGFEAVELQKFSLKEQARMLASTEVVILSLGSALANLVFLPPGAKIVELLNPRCVQTAAQAVGSRRGAEYYFALAEGQDPTVHEIVEDLRMDIPKLLETLRLAGIS